MKWIVVSHGLEAVVLWDGKSYDPDHPGEKAGTMTMWLGIDHGFKTGDKVSLSIKKETE